jgi:7-cyano-7-deazaguanine synthase
MKRLVLVSGGMDSATALALAARDCIAEELYAISFRYGSRHEKSEIAAAYNVAAWFLPVNENHFVIPVPHEVFAGSGSALIGESEVPNEEYHDPRKETPSATVVPFRNAIFLSLAVAVAESRGIDEVWAGTHGTDAMGWAYPDCSPEFGGALAAAAYIGTLHKVRIVFPFMWHTKADIVRLAVGLDAPLEDTWSCYRGGDVQCGQCPTCLERINAFRLAGYIDPVSYHETPEWDRSLKIWIPLHGYRGG